MKSHPILLLIIVFAVVSAAAYLVTGRTQTTDTETSSGVPDDFRNQSLTTATDSVTVPPGIAEFCGNCHGFPRPETFPRDAWFAEVERGFRFYRESGRSDLKVPTVSEVTAWYRQAAPDDWVVPPSAAAIDSRTGFDKQSMVIPEQERFPAVSFLHWDAASRGSGGVLGFCDMQSGHVSRLDFQEAGLKEITLAKLANPAHIEAFDLDQDGIPELVIAELGSFQPADHQLGRISFLKQTPDRTSYQKGTLAKGFGRIADVRAGDFDQDGDADLVVAEFGWLKSGRVLLLTNVSSDPRQADFETHVIDSRHGAIHVPVVDLNQDGRLDFVALISQEFEVVEAFLNAGAGQFERKTIHSAGDPSYGSSGIHPVDLDRDGDTDILYTNGDSLDSHYLKPYHAVHWLENTGTFPFVDHEIARLPGASIALPGDLDGDGDMDVIAASYLPVTLLRQLPAGTYDSLVWYENLGQRRFECHRLENSTPGHLALEVGDFDADNDMDLAVGNHGDAYVSGDREWLSIWWNRHRETELPGTKP